MAETEANMVPLSRIGPGGAVAALLGGISLAFREKQLRSLVIMSLFANALIFAGVLVGLYFAVAAATAPLVEGEVAFLAAAGTVIRWAVMAGALLISPILVNAIAMVVLQVFRQRIFRAARLLAGGAPVEESGGMFALLRELGVELRRLLRLLVLTALCLPLNLIPFAGSAVYVALQFLITASTLAWDLLAPHFEMHGLGYNAQKRFLARSRATALAFGATAVLLCLVPVAQILFISTNVVGAAIVSARLDEGADVVA